MMRVTWLGHATFELRFDKGEVLLLDPWIEGNPKYPTNYKIAKVDAIAISHAHFDHINDVVPLAKKFNPKIVAIFETATWLEKSGVKNTMGINKGGTVDLGFVRLTMTHALHSCSIKAGEDLIYGGEAAGYVLTLPDGRTAYYAGDTSLFGDMKLIGEFYRPELAFLPIGDYYTMDPRQAAHAARMLGVKRVIPMHYGTFPALIGRPEELEKEVKSEGIEVLAMQPGQSIEW
jgi:L-ascorbate metabolism protein UlaG (beta-lactamase superfamily)